MQMTYEQAARPGMLLAFATRRGSGYMMRSEKRGGGYGNGPGRRPPKRKRAGYPYIFLSIFISVLLWPIGMVMLWRRSVRLQAGTKLLISLLTLCLSVFLIVFALTVPVDNPGFTAFQDKASDWLDKVAEDVAVAGDAAIKKTGETWNVMSDFARAGTDLALVKGADAIDWCAGLAGNTRGSVKRMLGGATPEPTGAATQTPDATDAATEALTEAFTETAAPTAKPTRKPTKAPTEAPAEAAGTRQPLFIEDEVSGEETSSGAVAPPSTEGKANEATHAAGPTKTPTEAPAEAEAAAPATDAPSEAETTDPSAEAFPSGEGGAPAPDEVPDAAPATDAPTEAETTDPSSEAFPSGEGGAPAPDEVPDSATDAPTETETTDPSQEAFPSGEGGAPAPDEVPGDAPATDAPTEAETTDPSQEAFPSGEGGAPAPDEVPDAPADTVLRLPASAPSSQDAQPLGAGTLHADGSFEPATEAPDGESVSATEAIPTEAPTEAPTPEPTEAPAVPSYTVKPAGEAVVYFYDTGSKGFHRTPTSHGMNGAPAHTLAEAYAAGKNVCNSCGMPPESILSEINVAWVDGEDRIHTTDACESFSGDWRLMPLADAVDAGYAPCTDCGADVYVEAIYPAPTPTPEPAVVNPTVPLKSAGEITVYYFDVSKGYHIAPDCVGMNGAPAHTLAEAVAAGKRACGNCNPPAADLIGLPMLWLDESNVCHTSDGCAAFKGKYTLILRDDALAQGLAACPDCGANEYLMLGTVLGAE